MSLAFTSFTSCVTLTPKTWFFFRGVHYSLRLELPFLLAPLRWTGTVRLRQLGTPNGSDLLPSSSGSLRKRLHSWQRRRVSSDHGNVSTLPSMEFHTVFVKSAACRSSWTCRLWGRCNISTGVIADQTDPTWCRTIWTHYNQKCSARWNRGLYCGLHQILLSLNHHKDSQSVELRAETVKDNLGCADVEVCADQKLAVS